MEAGMTAKSDSERGELRNAPPAAFAGKATGGAGTGGSPGPPVRRDKDDSGVRGRCLRAGGFLAACAAASALAAGTITPAMGFAVFVLLLGGLSLINLGVIGGGGGGGGDGSSLA